MPGPGGIGLVALALATLAASCHTTDARPHVIALKNESEIPLVVLAITADVAARIELAPEVSVADYGEQAVGPGAEILLGADDIMGDFKPDEELVFFLYRVDGSVAVYTGTKPVARLTLGDAFYRVTITPEDIGVPTRETGRPTPLHRHRCTRFDSFTTVPTIAVVFRISTDLPCHLPPHLRVVSV